MMKSKHKLISLISICQILLIVLVCPVNAISAEQVLNLEKACETAINSNQQIRIYDQKIINASNQFDYAMRKARTMANEIWNTDTERAELKRTMELIPIQRKNIVDVLKLKRSETVDEISRNVKSNYYKYILMDEQLNNQQKAINRLQKKLEVIKSQVIAGKDTAKSIEETEISIKLTEQRLISIKRDIDKVKMKLNTLIGRDIKADLKLNNEEIAALSKIELDIDKIIDNRTIKSSAILQASNNAIEAKVEFDITNFSSTKVVPDGIEDAENKVLDSEYAYKKLLEDEKVKCYNEYNDLLNLNDDITIKKLQMEVNQKDLSKAEIQYNKGLINVIAYNSAIQTYEDSVIAYKQALVDYKIAFEDFMRYN